MADYQVTRTDINPIGNEIKTSALMQYVSEGATLDESNANWPVEDGKKVAVPGLAIARVTATGKWVPWQDADAANYNDFGVMDEKVIFNGADQIVGQVIVLGSVLEAACTGVTATFKGKVPRIRFE